MFMRGSIRQNLMARRSKKSIQPMTSVRFLRKFYDWETSRHVFPAKLAEFDVWKLILRLLRR